MSARDQWVFDPDSGGKKIPETVKRDIEKRIHTISNEQFSVDISAWIFAFVPSFARLTHIPNHRSRKIGRRRTGQRPKKNIWKGCATLLSTSAVCGISVTTGEVLPFTPTATRSTSFLYTRMVSVSDLQRKRSSHPQWFTYTNDGKAGYEPKPVSISPGLHLPLPNYEIYRIIYNKCLLSDIYYAIHDLICF
jgi:hypothetical protein